MNKQIHQSSGKKRQSETSSEETEPRVKKPLLYVGFPENEERVYEFKVLLPNGCTVSLKFRESGILLSVQELITRVKNKYLRLRSESQISKAKREVDWGGELYFLDEYDNKFRNKMDLRRFKENKTYILRLHDGQKEADVYESMWDLTPDPQLLNELPEEYTFVTALADLIDNSLQAVWSNHENNTKRLISVEVREDKISIFDTGRGMDNSAENSLVKWGRMGASLHRLSRKNAIRGKPPYLMPAFGMFGYGGFIASMHLGRRTQVSSKTTASKKVHFLRLKRDSLLKITGSESTWSTSGGIRDPLVDELEKAPDGSFTKVDIFEPKMRSVGELQLQCKLKDIYFPYIQCDDLSKTRKTATPIQFQVNGVDLAEIEGGEVATTNLHSCNGPEFLLQLRFLINQDNVTMSSPGTTTFQEANARLRCVYLPVVQGKESIERILEKLEDDGYGIAEKFESFSRVSVRRLGRLLPDARWAWLPFMDLRQRKGDRAQLLKRCCMRIKCFIETDAGFNPTPSKTDLAHKNPFTIALKDFGNKNPADKNGDVAIEIRRDDKSLTLSQLDKQFHEWILKMHERYDQEVDCGMDEPIIIVEPSNKKELNISMNVVRVHKVFMRKGRCWKSGQKLKVLKGGYQGCSKIQYFTLEYILLEGFQGDSGGEASLICRPLSITEEHGCLLTLNNGNPSLDLRQSILFPVSTIDNGKCLAIEDDEWNNQLEKQNQKSPSSIEILSEIHCRQLGLQVALPIEDVVAGRIPPKEIVAVVRPASFNFGSPSKNLDQKYILKDNFEMGLEIKFLAEDEEEENHLYSARTEPSSRNGFHGLYIFKPCSKSRPLFQKAGHYTFSFSLRESSCRSCMKKIRVKASPEVERLELLDSKKINLRAGSCFRPISIACFDRFDNRIQLTKVPKIVAEVRSKICIVANTDKMKVSKSTDRLYMKVEGLYIESSELDKIRPHYEATLMIGLAAYSPLLQVPFQVVPGTVDHLVLHPTNFKKQLIPGHVIKELALEIFDAYGNHAKENEEIMLKINGMNFQDKVAELRKVNEHGYVDLDGILKVTAGYGNSVSFSVLIDKKVIFSEEFQIGRRQLRANMIPEKCVAGSQLENVIFEIVNSRGEVDINIHDEEKFGQSHTLTLKSESNDIDDSIKYTFSHGRCIVRAIQLPDKEGIFSFVAAHSRYSDLQLAIKVHLEAIPVIDCQPLSFERISLPLPYSPGLRNPKLIYDEVRHQSPDDKTLHFLGSLASADVGTFLGSFVNEHKMHEAGVKSCGLNIRELEEKLEDLETQKEAIKQDLSKLQVARKLVLADGTRGSAEKELIMERIQSRTNCAAAVVSKMIKDIPDQDHDNVFEEHIIGVVALLGTVQSIELSRILAEYLGDKILAIVCKTYDDIAFLERHDNDGNLDHDTLLHQYATKLGKTINGRYLVLCLEKISPYPRVCLEDPQRMLELPDPALPDGSLPAGFLGYAVNMIHLNAEHLHTKTDAGDGLRETLFYRLFGNLQVYEDRESMKMASPCTEYGAISLDGGIMRGNGAISLGSREPDVLFPVVSAQNQVLSPQEMEVMRQYKEKKLQLSEIIADIGKVNRTLRRAKSKFEKRKDEYNKFMEENAPFIGSL